jgi:hypothetical protein
MVPLLLRRTVNLFLKGTRAEVGICNLVRTSAILQTYEWKAEVHTRKSFGFAVANLLVRTSAIDCEIADMQLR